MSEILFEWGMEGLCSLLTKIDAVVIVDVLSFSTSVEIAVSRGANIFPYAFNEDMADLYAQNAGGIAASKERSLTEYSLSPTSLLNIPSGTNLVLPSLNGSRLSFATGMVPTFCGCLRNASAVAREVAKYGKVAVIAAGEKWQNGGLRPALEDLVGAGAIISQITGTKSQESKAAEATFHAIGLDLRQTESARELVERGFESDVKLALQLDVSQTVPRMYEGAYIAG